MKELIIILLGLLFIVIGSLIAAIFLFLPVVAIIMLVNLTIELFTNKGINDE